MLQKKFNVKVGSMNKSFNAALYNKQPLIKDKPKPRIKNKTLSNTQSMANLHAFKSAKLVENSPDKRKMTARVGGVEEVIPEETTSPKAAKRMIGSQSTKNMQA